MIAGALATLLASGAYFAADSIKTNANIYRNANRMDDEGVFWPTNPEVERMLQHDIRSLWETGKRDFILRGKQQREGSLLRCLGRAMYAGKRL